jgi:hypothetical protein
MINIFGKKFYSEKELKKEIADVGMEMIKLQNNLIKKVIESNIRKIKKFNDEVLNHKIIVKQGKNDLKVIETQTYNNLFERYFGDGLDV